MRHQPEKAEQAAICKLLRLLGASVYVIGRNPPRDGRRQFGTGIAPGIPDVLAFLPPADKGLSPYTPLWIEVKAPNGKMSPPQKTFETLCVFSRQAHVVGGIDAVTDWLRAGGWLK